MVGFMGQPGRVGDRFYFRARHLMYCRTCVHSARPTAGGTARTQGNAPAPKLFLVQRTVACLRGARLHDSMGKLDPHSGNLFWPQDHAWCVATEIDLFCTFIAVRKSWPKLCWLTRVLRHGACFLETRSRGIVMTSIPEVRGRVESVARSLASRATDPGSRVSRPYRPRSRWRVMPELRFR